MAHHKKLIVTSTKLINPPVVEFLQTIEMVIVDTSHKLYTSKGSENIGNQEIS